MKTNYAFYNSKWVKYEFELNVNKWNSRKFDIISKNYKLYLNLLILALNNLLFLIISNFSIFLNDFRRFSILNYIIFFLKVFFYVFKVKFYNNAN